MRRVLTRCRGALLGLVLVLATIQPGFAVEPDEILPNAAQEQRARALSSELRCLVCQNQSIDDSNAPLARDLRLLVRERIVAGDNDSQIKAFLVARYGDFVLLKPPINSHTLLLWLGPALVLLAGAVTVVITSRRRVASASAPLTERERQELAKLTEES